MPQIAALFAIEVKPGAQAPRPLRPPRPKREFKRKPKVAKPAVDAPAIDTAVAVATVAPEAVDVTSPDASPAVETA